MHNPIYECVMLKGLNKKGLVQPDEYGYRPMILGGLDIVSSKGEVYAYEGAHKLFEMSSSFQRKVQGGALRGEYEHPKREPGQSDASFLARVMGVDGRCVSHHIRKVWLDFDNVRDRDGKRVIAIIGELAPSGPFGSTLERTLNNPHENCSFSVRCASNLSTDRMGRTVRSMYNIVTWDHVPEPGQHIADKFYNPSMEGLGESMILTQTTVNRAMREQEASGNFSQESRFSLAELAVSFGWMDKDVLARPMFGWARP